MLSCPAMASNLRTLNPTPSWCGSVVLLWVHGVAHPRTTPPDNRRVRCCSQIRRHGPRARAHRVRGGAEGCHLPVPRPAGAAAAGCGGGPRQHGDSRGVGAQRAPVGGQRAAYCMHGLSPGCQPIPRGPSHALHHMHCVACAACHAHGVAAKVCLPRAALPPRPKNPLPKWPSWPQPMVNSARPKVTPYL